MSLLTSLTSYWKLDESSGSAADSAGGGNTLTNNGSITYGAGKINNGALLVAASSQCFSHADNASLSITGDMTFSIWVKMTSQPALNSAMNLMSKWDASGNQRSYQLNYQDASGVKKIEFRYTSDGISNLTIFQCNQTLTNATWFHLSVTLTALTPAVTVYVNGASVSGSLLASAATAIFDGTAAFSVGSLTTSSQFLDARVDEIGLWPRAISASEASALYNYGTGIQWPFNPGGFLSLLI